MVLAVATGHVGDVPDSIRTGCVHDRTAGKGVRETLRTPLRVILVIAAGLETAVPEGWIKTVLQLAVSRFFLILGDDVGIGDGV